LAVCETLDTLATFAQFATDLVLKCISCISDHKNASKRPVLARRKAAQRTPPGIASAPPAILEL
jgi:hypothetical protein